MYIGKSKDVERRINEEQHTTKFLSVLDADIFFTVLANKCEMDGVEKLLINHYKPRLNIADNYNSLTKNLINPNSLIWEKLEIPKRELKIYICDDRRYKEYIKNWELLKIFHKLFHEFYHYKLPFIYIDKKDTFFSTDKETLYLRDALLPTFKRYGFLTPLYDVPIYVHIAHSTECEVYCFKTDFLLNQRNVREIYNITDYIINNTKLEFKENYKGD